MKEFTFNCLTCGQPILAKHDWIGRQMNCPSCDTRITITPSAQAPKKRRLPTRPKARTKPAARSKRLPGFP